MSAYSGWNPEFVASHVESKREKLIKAGDKASDAAEHKGRIAQRFTAMRLNNAADVFYASTVWARQIYVQMKEKQFEAQLLNQAVEKLGQLVMQPNQQSLRIEQIEGE